MINEFIPPIRLLLLAGLMFGSTNLAAETMQDTEHYPDHFVVGISDLEKGVHLFEELTGVTPVFGGTHPDIGTQNALVSLGEHTYLEIIAPNPEADPEVLDEALKKQFMDPLLQMNELTPFLWVVGTTNIDETISQLHTLGIETTTPEPGVRKKPDGSLLEWRASFITRPQSRSLPFFIQWNDPAISPPKDSPRGCQLAGFSISGPDPDQVQSLVDKLKLDTTVSRAPKTSITIELDCPNGKIRL